MREINKDEWLQGMKPGSKYVEINWNDAGVFCRFFKVQIFDDAELAYKSCFFEGTYYMDDIPFSTDAVKDAVELSMKNLFYEDKAFKKLGLLESNCANDMAWITLERDIEKAIPDVQKGENVKLKWDNNWIAEEKIYSQEMLAEAVAPFIKVIKELLSQMLAESGLIPSDFCAVVLEGIWGETEVFAESIKDFFYIEPVKLVQNSVSEKVYTGKIYAVKKGRKPGLYFSWEECSKQVAGVSGAQYKSFKYTSLEEYAEASEKAEAYIKADEKSDEKKNNTANAIEKAINPIVEYSEYEKLKGIYREDVVAFVDGSFNENMCSYAVLVYRDGDLIYFEGDVIDDLGGRQATGEYLAAVKALDYCIPMNLTKLKLVFDHVEIGRFCNGEHKPNKKNKYGNELVEKYQKITEIGASVDLIWTHSHQSAGEVNEHFLLLGNLAADQLANLVRKTGRLSSEEDGCLEKLKSLYPKIPNLMKACPSSADNDWDWAKEVENAEFVSDGYANISGKTGLAVAVSNVMELKERLKSKIIGQDASVEKFARAYFRGEMSVGRGKNPKNVALFAGPPGVGKTYLAETFAEYCNKPYKRFDMSGFAHHESFHQMVGFAPTWKDSEEGILTSYVKSNPNAVLLFDEIEKAHTTVARLFLQILDGGILYDEYHKENVSFKDVTIIFTTNVGHDLYEGKEDEDLTKLTNQVVVDGLLKDIDPMTNAPYFPAEIASRLASFEIIMFNHMKQDDIRRVIAANAKKCIEENEKLYRFTIAEDECLVPTLLYRNGGAADARNASKYFKKFLGDALLSLMEKILTEEGSNVVDSLSKVEIVHEFDEKLVSDEVKELYKNIDDSEAFKENCRKLVRRHRYLDYKVRYEYSVEEMSAKIVLYDFNLKIAVQSEDADEILSTDAKPNVHWDDIIVEDDVKDELKYFIDYLNKPDEYAKKGGNAPRGVLMYGPAGTGKTSLAKVVATESDVVFLNVDSTMLRGRGASQVHHIFSVAKKYAPSVLFIDEIDAIAGNRSKYGLSDTLNALLTEMDGFTSNESRPVFVMAATNLGSDIDPALMRRFDRTICIDVPSEKNRERLLEMFVNRGKSRFSRVTKEELESIAKRSRGMSPAKLDLVFKTAIRDSIRKNLPVDDEMLDEAFEKCLYGDSVRTNTYDDMLQTARHEMGHAIQDLLNGSCPVFICAVSRANHNGYVLSDNKERSHLTKNDYLSRIRTCLGGRAAEMEYYGCDGLTSGAASDLEYATQTAKMMVTSLGMYEEEIGLQVISEEEYKYNDEAKKLVNRILSEQLTLARENIKGNRTAMDNLVDALMNSDKKYLNQAQIRRLFDEA